jgi:hypothetical protein
VAALLCFVGRHFTLRTLRYFTAITAAVLVVLITRYVLPHPAKASSDLVNSFRQGADELGAAFFHPLLLVLPETRSRLPGDRVARHRRPPRYRYRVLEAWAMRREAPVLDTSAHLTRCPPAALSDKVSPALLDSRAGEGGSSPAPSQGPGSLGYQVQ